MTSVKTAQEKSATEWARDMSDLRAVKPRPLHKLYGQRGPTPEQRTKWDADMRAWNAKYRHTSVEQKKALERDNAAFRVLVNARAAR